MQEVYQTESYNETNYILDFAIPTKKLTSKIKSTLNIALKSSHNFSQNYVFLTQWH